MSNSLFHMRFVLYNSFALKASRKSYRRPQAKNRIRAAGSNSALAGLPPSGGGGGGGVASGGASTSSRQLADQLKKFIQASEAPPTTHSSAGASLSDTGFLLLRLKDQLLDPRGAFFATEFASRPYNGLELLIKVVVVLQAIVNSVNNGSKISNLLTRTNSSSSRKRKAAVAEADCIECIKIILEKSPPAWRSIMEHAGNLEVILYSVNSPQLDSKCYALEIILLLLDQPHGFTMLFRSLSFIAGRNRDEIRLALFVAQLKHGLHTSKLHIQILVVRLLNKLLLQAPTPAHRIMAQVDAELALFSPLYVEKVSVRSATLIAGINSPLSGYDSLMEELRMWKSLCVPITARYATAEQTRLSPLTQGNSAWGYSYSETDSDAASRSEYPRRLRNGSKFSGQTAVVKNVERQRYRKQGGVDSQSGSGGSAAGSRTTLSMTVERDGRDRDREREQYYPNDHAYTMTKTWDPVTGYPLSRAEKHDRLDRRFDTGMRRAKSESTMLFDDSTQQRGLHRNLPQYDQHPIEQSSRQFSRSTHDLTRQPSGARLRPSSATMTRSPSDRRVRQPQHHRSATHLAAPTPTAARGGRPLSSPPPRASPRARFAEPLIEKPTGGAIQGFSYLFPAQPVLSSLPTKHRSRTPDPFKNQASPHSGRHSPPGRPPSAPIFDRSISPPVAYTAETRANGEVIYIPIAVEATNTVLRRRSTAERRPGTPAAGQSPSAERDYTLDSRSPSSYNGGTYGDDVRDALSQFDYLNDYEALSSNRGGGGGGNNGNARYATATYHF